MKKFNHTGYICKVSPQCAFSCGLLSNPFVRKLCYNNHTGEVFLQHVFLDFFQTTIIKKIVDTDVEYVWHVPSMCFYMI